jgi:hypothetical protein
MSHAMWLARTSRIAGNRRWQAARQRQNLRSAQLPLPPRTTHRLILWLYRRKHTHVRVYGRYHRSLSPSIALKNCFFRLISSVALEISSAWRMQASGICRQRIAASHAELVDTAPGSRGPEAHLRFGTASPVGSPDLYTATIQVSRGKMLQIVAVGA